MLGACAFKKYTTVMCVQELARDEELRVVLAGHSVGAYIVVRMLAQLPREKVLQVYCYVCM